MVRPIEVEAKQAYRVWLKYDDGASGELDLGHLVGQGVFKAWDTPGYFETVRVTEYGSIAWGNTDDIELCPDALYMRLTGKPVEEVWPGLVGAEVAQDMSIQRNCYTHGTPNGHG